MAVINKLTLTFGTADGKSATMSYKYVKSDITSANVKALINAILTNGVIFASNPVTAKGAKLVQTEETAIDISDD